MRYSTVAASVALFGAAAMALPNAAVVYQTEMVTITSCGPEVVSCPARTQTPATTSTAVAATETPVDTPSYGETTAPTYGETSAPVYGSSELSPTYTTSAVEIPTGTGVPAESAPAGTGVPAVSAPAGTGVPAVSAPAGTGAPAGSAPAATGYASAPLGTGASYVPSGTGYPSSAQNTSAPIASPTPSEATYEGSASATGFSLIAIAAAAGALFLA
jgi:hypothetical protein